MIFAMKLVRSNLRPWTVAVLGVLTAVVLRAAPPQPTIPDQLDLKAAIQFALENNFSIRQARERIKQQEGVIIEVKAREIPNVNATGGAQRNQKDISETFPQSDRAWSIQLTASQTLYAGGGVRSAIRGAKLTREAALLDLQAVINDSLLNVRTSFYNVLLTREQIRVEESNLDLLQQQLKTASDRYSAGTVSSFEKLRAEVAVANAKVPLITAKNNYRLAIETLRQNLGFSTNDPSSMRKTPEIIGSLDYVPAQFDLESAFDAAHNNRPDLLRLAKLTDARDQAIITAKAGALPNVSAVAGWELFKGLTNSFGDSSDGFLVGVQGSWAIFDGRATQGRVAQARSLRQQSLLTYIETQLTVEVDVRRAFSTWQESVELVDASKAVVGQAEESVRLANARYTAGTGTQLDVLQAQVDLTTAQTNRLQAYYQHAVALATLRRAMGQLDSFTTS